MTLTDNGDDFAQAPGDWRAWPAVVCTSVSASWCPIHGDCACPNREDSLNDEACPLHCALSTHAEEDDAPWWMA